MFVGHYSASFILKKADKNIPLWLLFAAAQFVDILWASFILTGTEKMRIIPGFTASNPLDLYYMPYTHSLAGALFWAALAGVGYLFWKRGSKLSAFLLGMAVLSHWLLDLIVHQPDLSLYDDTLKMGFGLWNYPIISLFLEMVLLTGSAFFYLYRNTGVHRSERKKTIAFVTVLVVVGVINLVLPPPASAGIFAVEALASYIAFALVAFWIEYKAKPRYAR
jgi:hypothetical protein